MRFIPVNFRKANGAIWQSNSGNTFQFSPSPRAILPSQSGSITNTHAGCDSLDIGYGADNFKIHRVATLSFGLEAPQASPVKLSLSSRTVKCYLTIASAL